MAANARLVQKNKQTSSSDIYTSSSSIVSSFVKTCPFRKTNRSCNSKYNDVSHAVVLPTPPPTSSGMITTTNVVVVAGIKKHGKRGARRNNILSSVALFLWLLVVSGIFFCCSRIFLLNEDLDHHAQQQQEQHPTTMVEVNFKTRDSSIPAAAVATNAITKTPADSETQRLRTSQNSVPTTTRIVRRRKLLLSEFLDDEFRSSHPPPSSDNNKPGYDRSKETSNTSTTATTNTVNHGNPTDTDKSQHRSAMTLEEASKGREYIISILQDAGISISEDDGDVDINDKNHDEEEENSVVDMTPATSSSGVSSSSSTLINDVLQLPTWEQIRDMYGDGPVIVGLDRCEAFRSRVPQGLRYIGVSGMFNTGTTAFGRSLQMNCRYENHQANRDRDDYITSYDTPDGTTAANHVESSSKKKARSKITNVHGMLNQVPWSKHKLAHARKTGHTLDATIDKDHVLNVVLIREPFYWMSSMCKNGYGLRWDHDSKKHCPNLVPNEYDRERYGKRAWLHAKNATSVPVWMGSGGPKDPRWDSLIHYWNEWYGSYLHDDYDDDGDGTNDTNTAPPRIMIRFEDTLFHGQEIMKTVCECGGGTLTRNTVEDEAEEIDTQQLLQPQADQEPIRADTRRNTRERHVSNHHLYHHTYLVQKSKGNAHKHGKQTNLVSAMIQYGTDLYRYNNMTEADIRYAYRHLDMNLMAKFHYKVDF